MTTVKTHFRKTKGNGGVRHRAAGHTNMLPGDKICKYGPCLECSKPDGCTTEKYGGK